MDLQHPFKILRRFLKGHPDLAEASTQNGFAKLVGCSPALIQAVEQRSKISTKLALKVQAATGVAIPWLAQMRDPREPIPAEGGGSLTHELVLASIGQARERHSVQVEQRPAVPELHPILKGRTSLMAAFVSGVSAEIGVDFKPSWGKELSDEPAQDADVSWNRRKAGSMAKWVEDELFEAISRNDYSLWDEISKALSRHRPAINLGSEMPHPMPPFADPGNEGVGDAEGRRRPEC